MKSLVSLTHSLSKLRRQDVETKAQMYAEFMKIARASNCIDNLSRQEEELNTKIQLTEQNIELAIKQREENLKVRRQRNTISFLATANMLSRGMHVTSQRYIDEVTACLVQYMPHTLARMVVSYAPEAKIRLLRPVHACSQSLVLEETCVSSLAKINASVCVVKNLTEEQNKTYFARYYGKNYSKKPLKTIFLTRYFCYKEHEDPLTHSFPYALLRITLSAPCSVKKPQASIKR